MLVSKEIVTNKGIGLFCKQSRVYEDKLYEVLQHFMKTLTFLLNDEEITDKKGHFDILHDMCTNIFHRSFKITDMFGFRSLLKFSGTQGTLTW